MISSLVTSQTPQRIARLAFIGGLALASTGCNWVALLSVSSSGQQGDSFSEAPALSADGRYLAFQSLASNLVANDTGGYADIFVRDTVTGITTRVSTDTAGTEGNHASFDPSISSDGSIVVFRSLASNLVPGDTNNQGDVFVHDRSTGVTSRVSVDSAGNEANNFSNDAAISEDGRYVDQGRLWYLDDDFETRAIVVGDLNRDGYPDVVKRSLDGRTPMFLSVCGDGNFLSVQLRDERSATNYFAVGATIEVISPKLRQVRWVRAGGSSIFAHSAMEASFGLGEGTVIGTLRVTWPDGEVQEFENLAANRRLQITREAPPE